jgi:hypothetical protein
LADTAGPAAKAMSCMMNEDYWELKFSVEVSTLYHDWRRSSLWATVRWVRIITLASAVIALVTAFSPPHLDRLASIIVAVVSILIAVVTLLDLVENFSGGAHRHEELYRRFKRLQVEMERYSAEADRHLEEWHAEAQSVRVDEPPTLWAVYARCWNQAIEHHATERRGYYRQIASWRAMLGWLISFNPQDFPAISRP